MKTNIDSTQPINLQKYQNLSESTRLLMFLNTSLLNSSYAAQTNDGYRFGNATALVLSKGSGTLHEVDHNALAMKHVIWQLQTDIKVHSQYM